MREIKFRAWDENNKIMHHDFQFIKSGDFGNDWIIFTSDKHKLGMNPSPLENPFFSQQIKIMQYTGLKDKNGKEIYEGDVCRFNPIKEEPVFFHGLAYVDNKKVGGSWKIIRCDNEGGEEWGLDSSSFWNEDFEVIGNIYENPELLEKS